MSKLFKIVISSASASAGVLVPASAFRAGGLVRRAFGSSGKFFPTSAQRSIKCLTRKDFGPRKPFCRFAALASSTLFASSSSSRSRMLAQMAEAEESSLPLCEASALVAHCIAEALGCMENRCADSCRSAMLSSAVAPTHRARRMASPVRQDEVRTSNLPPIPLRSLMPKADKLLSGTPSARSRSPAAPVAPPLLAICNVSAAAS
mmetsp:Transcript_72069/g.206883  ORF Transcript_72069/g.206883 Transcript_72069/m.206883 type:complete len:205 (+) Transcript_72069:241-855(+)